jgi:hypothetical protein
MSTADQETINYDASEAERLTEDARSIVGSIAIETSPVVTREELAIYEAAVAARKALDTAIEAVSALSFVAAAVAAGVVLPEN